MSVADAIVIFDIDFYFVTREWFYTALTRATSLSEIYYWAPEMRLHDLGAVKESDLIARIEAKIAGHREADLKTGRSWAESDYVDVPTVLALLKEQRNRCCVCHEHLLPAWTKPKEPRQFSIDRLDNDLAHVKSNVRMACLRCNVSKH